MRGSYPEVPGGAQKPLGVYFNRGPDVVILAMPVVSQGREESKGGHAEEEDGQGEKESQEDKRRKSGPKIRPTVNMSGPSKSTLASTLRYKTCISPNFDAFSLVKIQMKLAETGRKRQILPVSASFRSQKMAACANAS